MSNWIEELREECAKLSQNKVAAKMGYSGATISLVLKGTYTGDLSTIEQRFKGVFKNAIVNCPVMGKLAKNICLDNQKLPFSTINPIRISLAAACRECSHKKGE